MVVRDGNRLIIRLAVEHLGHPLHLARIHRGIVHQAHIQGIPGINAHLVVQSDYPIRGVPGQAAVHHLSAVSGDNDTDIVGEGRFQGKIAGELQCALDRGGNLTASAGVSEIFRGPVAVQLQAVGIPDTLVNGAVGDQGIPFHLVELTVENRLHPEIDPIPGAHGYAAHTRGCSPFVIIGTDGVAPQFGSPYLNRRPHAVGGGV